MGYPNRRLAKIQSENKTQSTHFPTMSGHRNTYTQIDNNIIIIIQIEIVKSEFEFKT